MHADIQQLIALRDGEPVAADAARHVRECARCTQNITALVQVESRLRELPPVQPPPDAWSRIKTRRERESGPALMRFRVIRIAALVAFMAVLVAAGHFLGQRAVNDNGSATALAGTASMLELQARSRELEYQLERYGSGGVMSMRTAGTIGELEDSIALIDFRLNAVRDEAQQRALWRQRVELMETLVTVHAAESYLDSI